MKENKTIQILSNYSVPLILGIVTALFWANIAPESYLHFLHTKVVLSADVHFMVNDIFMAFFFAIAAVEIMHNLLPGGHLNPVRKAVTPLFATAGGLMGPAIVFITLNFLIGMPDFARGWAIPTATDIAISWLFARVVFGAKHPAIAFLMLVAIADDGIGLAIIAIFYPDPVLPVQPLWIILPIIGMITAYFMKKSGIKSYWFYILIPGLISWIGMFNARLHPALALIFIIPFLPHKNYLNKDGEEQEGTLMKFENDFKLFIDFGLFFFGLTNAGVQFASMSELTLIVFLSLFIGKSCGIFLFSKISVMLGNPMPAGIGNKELFTLGVVAAIGLTVALFVSGVAYLDLTLQGAAKMGALLSALNGLFAIILGKVLCIKKIH